MPQEDSLPTRQMKTAKTIKKPKPKTTGKLKEETWKVFSKYIRLRDCLRTTGTPDFGKCITCTVQISIKEADAGHFVPGRRNSILFDETCVHLQCQRCNRFLHGEVLKYRRAIIRLYGEGVDIELEDKATERKVFSREELAGLKEYYTEKIKELEGI